MSSSIRGSQYEVFTRFGVLLALCVEICSSVLLWSSTTALLVSLYVNNVNLYLGREVRNPWVEFCFSYGTGRPKCVNGVYASKRDIMGQSDAGSHRKAKSEGMSDTKAAR